MRIARKKLIAIALAVVWLMPSSGQAATVNWLFSSDAGAAGLNAGGGSFDYDFIGSFDYDATTNTFSNISVLAQGTGIVAGVTFSTLGPFTSNSGQINLVSGSQMLNMIFQASMSDAGGTIGLFSGVAGNCFSGDCTIGIGFPAEQFGISTSSVFGSIEGTPAPSVVPLPAALPLYGAGLAIMGFIGWRRKRRAAVAAV